MRLVVEAEVVGHHVELVGRGELDVPVGIGEELGQLGLFGVDPDDGLGQVTEQGGGALIGMVGSSRHDLGKRVELLHGPAFGDPLGAEGHVDGWPSRSMSRSTIRVTPGNTVLRRMRSWPSTSWSATASTALDHRLGIGIEVLVDRRPDDDDQVLASAHRGGIGRGCQGCRRPACEPNLRGARLAMGHLARPHPVHRRIVGVVEHRPEGPGRRRPGPAAARRGRIHPEQ